MGEEVSAQIPRKGTHGPIRRFRITEESCECWNDRAWLVTK